MSNENLVNPCIVGHFVSTLFQKNLNGYAGTHLRNSLESNGRGSAGRILNLTTGSDRPWLADSELVLENSL